MLLSTDASTDAYNKRLIVEVLLRDETGFLSKRGDLPTHHSAAAQCRTRVFGVLPREVVLSEATKPWTLCKHFSLPQCGHPNPPVLTCHQLGSKETYIHRDSHMPSLGKAQFQELGICELMLVQQTLVRGVPSQVYSMAPTTPEDVDRLPTHDYLFCYKARGKVPIPLTGIAAPTWADLIVNQGGLLPAFTEWCQH